MDMGILDFKGVPYKGQEQFIEFFSRLGFENKDWTCWSLYKIMDGRYVKC